MIPAKFCHAGPTVNLHMAEILAKGYRNYIFFLVKSSSQSVKNILDFCLHKVRFLKLDHDTLPGYRGQVEIADRPTLSLFSPCKQKLTRSFSFAENDSLHMLDYSFFFSGLSVMKTNLASCDSKFAPWLGNCLFWFADQNTTKVEKLRTGYVKYTYVKYITHFCWKNHSKVRRMQRYVE